MPVDLAAGQQGVITFRSGEQFWCLLVEPDDTTFLVRYEHGWYALYQRDGIQLCCGVVIHRDGSRESVVNHDRDIVAFEPGPCRDNLPSEVTP